MQLSAAVLLARLTATLAQLGGLSALGGGVAIVLFTLIAAVASLFPLLRMGEIVDPIDGADVDARQLLNSL